MKRTANQNTAVQTAVTQHSGKAFIGLTDSASEVMIVQCSIIVDVDDEAHCASEVTIVQWLFTEVDDDDNGDDDDESFIGLTDSASEVKIDDDDDNGDDDGEAHWQCLWGDDCSVIVHWCW